jgi:hypothetical protein
MNDKIKLLAEQAGLRIPDDAEYNSHVYRYALERFANSIVRECAKVCDDVAKDSHGEWKGGAWECETGIKEHFGVE